MFHYNVHSIINSNLQEREEQVRAGWDKKTFRRTGKRGEMGNGNMERIPQPEKE